MSELKPIILVNKIKKYKLNINDEDYILILTPKKSEEEIKMKLIRSKNPLYTYRAIISLYDIKESKTFSEQINNLNDLINYLSESFISKSYTNYIREEGILLTIFPKKENILIPNIQILLENSFSEKEIYQQKKQEETIELLKEEINLVKLNQEKIENFLHKNQNAINSIRMGLKFISSKYTYFQTSGEWSENFRANSISVLPNHSMILTHQNNIKYIDNETKTQKFEIKNAHQKLILTVTIIDNENFITCSTDHTIKVWKIENNSFVEIDKLIGHNDYVSQVLYLKDKSIISSSNDKTIRIWKNIQNKYQSITSFITANPVKALLNFNDNIFISGDNSGNLNIYDNIFYCKQFTIPECVILWSESMKKIDDNKIIIGGGFDKKVKIIDITQKKIENEVTEEILVIAICIIDNYVVLGGAKPYNISIRTINSLTLVQRIDIGLVKEIHFLIKLENNDILIITSHGDEIKYLARNNI